MPCCADCATSLLVAGHIADSKLQQLLQDGCAGTPCAAGLEDRAIHSGEDELREGFGCRVWNTIGTLAMLQTMWIV